MPSKKYYHRYKKKGLCAECGHQKEQPDKARCNKCLKKVRDCNRQKYEERVSNGICAKCSEPAVPGFSRCYKHLEYNTLNQRDYTAKYPEKVRAYNQKRLDRYRSEHRCLACGCPLDPDDARVTCGCSGDLPRNFHIGGKVYYGNLNQASTG